MNKIILNKLEKNNETKLNPHKGQWLLGKKKIVIVNTEPIYKILDGSLNGLKYMGIGKYTIQPEKVPCIYVFTFNNVTTKQVEYVIIPQTELLDKLHSQNYVGDSIKIRFWLTEKSMLVESYGCGAEAEFMALWIDQSRDFTPFLNNWTMQD